MSTREIVGDHGLTMVDIVRMTDHLQTLDEKQGINARHDDVDTQLRFLPHTGRIWLGDQRMLLMHAKTFAALRHQIIEHLGSDTARAMLMRIGYASGHRDAELARRAWPDGDELGAFMAGARLHSFEGVAKVTPVSVTSDIKRGQFRGEYLWHGSLEALESVSAFGRAQQPVCWMQLGYACGYGSAFLDKLVVFRELECAAMGAAACRIVGQPAEAWDQYPEEARLLQTEFTSRHERVARVINLPVAPRKTAQDVGNAATASSRPRSAMPGMVGVSAAFVDAQVYTERVASTSATVLLSGESGVGKELFARAVHDLSPRHNGPFVAVNCAAIPDTLVESELFGVEKGAFTGATLSRPGRFQRASGGTLFLDEIGSLSLIAQAKLLRALQEGEIDRVGSTHPTKVNVRIVAATNKDLCREVREERFREDLYFRLNVISIRIPPLRERAEDIPPLMEHFLVTYNELYGKNVIGFGAPVVEALLKYRFSGNVRELRNLVERGVAGARDGTRIELTDIFRSGELAQPSLAVPVPNHGAQHAVESPIDAPTESSVDVTGLLLAKGDFSFVDHERALYARALEQSRGNISAAARLLGLTRSQLAHRLKSMKKNETH